MRICLISREYPPETGWGGIATFTKHLAKGLVQIGHEVEVISLSTSGKPGTVKTTSDEGIKVHRVFPADIPGDPGVFVMSLPYSNSMVKTQLSVWDTFLKLHAEHPFDVVDTPELLFEGLTPAITRVAPLLIRLYTPHSKCIAEHLNNITSTFDHELMALLERVAMSSADVITSPSDDLADFVSKDMNYPREKIAIVRNPIDADEFSSEGPKAITLEGKKIVLFVGRLEHRKGISYLVDAIPEIKRACPEAHFVILGNDTPTGPGGTSILKSLLSSLKATDSLDSVTFIPRVPLSDLPAYYRSAEICVVPSLYDNSPYTCLEAMSCGRVVVGTTSGGIGEYIVNGQSGVLVEPANSQEISAAIISLLQDDQKRIAFGQNARKRVLENFQRSIIAQKTVALYELACKRFTDSHQNQLYKKPPQLLLPDALDFVTSYEQMLSDFLYVYSHTFRLLYWWRLAFKRPKLFLAKTGVSALSIVFKLIGKKPNEPSGLINQLREQIRQKEKSTTLKREMTVSQIAK